MSEQRARKELLEYLERGRLRDAVAGDLSVEAQDVLVDVVSEACTKRREPTLGEAALARIKAQNKKVQ